MWFFEWHISFSRLDLESPGLENIRIHTLDGKIENDNLDFAVAFVDEELRRIRSSARAYVIKRVPHPKGFPRDLEKWFYYGTHFWQMFLTAPYIQCMLAHRYENSCQVNTLSCSPLDQG